MNYTVAMEYRVLVTPDDLYHDEEELTPELAEKIALGWLAEEPVNCNQIVLVMETAANPLILGRIVRRTEDGHEVPA